MAKAVASMVRESIESFANGDLKKTKEVIEYDDVIDNLFNEVKKELADGILNGEATQEQILDVLMIAKYLERIGDHAVNICEYTKMIEEKNITFSKEVIGEIAQMREICVKALSKVESIDNGINVAEIAGIEEKIDEMTERFRKNQIDRMQVGKCSDEGCVLYSEMLTDFERIGDHILNVGQEMAGAVNE